MVPVSTLPFPFHLFRCPFEQRHLRALELVGVDRDDWETPVVRASAPRSDLSFRGSIDQPARTPTDASERPHGQPRTARGHRGSLLLRCRALSSPCPCRFIPAPPQPHQAPPPPTHRHQRLKPTLRRSYRENEAKGHNGRSQREGLRDSVPGRRAGTSDEEIRAYFRTASRQSARPGTAVLSVDSSGARGSSDRGP